MNSEYIVKNKCTYNFIFIIVVLLFRIVRHYIMYTKFLLGARQIARGYPLLAQQLWCCCRT